MQMIRYFGENPAIASLEEITGEILEERLVRKT